MAALNEMELKLVYLHGSPKQVGNPVKVEEKAVLELTLSEDWIITYWTSTADLSAAGIISSNATFNLFNWYKNNEGGLWLVACRTKAGIWEVRRIQAHPWTSSRRTL